MELRECLTIVAILAAIAVGLSNVSLQFLPALFVAVCFWIAAGIMAAHAYKAHRKGPSVAPQAIVKNDKPLVTLTALELAALCEKKTEIQIQHATAPFIGKWIVISGPIRNIYQVESAQIVVVVVKLNPESDSGGVFSYFPQVDFDKLSHLQMSDVITFKARIKEIARHNITVMDCELLNVEPAAKPPSPAA